MCILIKGWIDTVYDDKLQYYKFHNIDTPIIYDIYRLYDNTYVCLLLIESCASFCLASMSQYIYASYLR